jgi:hypothetical protein
MAGGAGGIVAIGADHELAPLVIAEADLRRLAAPADLRGHPAKSDRRRYDAGRH